MSRLYIVFYGIKDKAMKKFFQTKYGPLAFSLISGLAYFALAMVLLTENTGGKGALLGFFFFPAIICGAALVLLKSIKLWLGAENYKKVYIIAVFHIFVIIMALAIIILKFVL